MACVLVLLCALAVPVNLHDGGVDHGVFHVRLARAGVKDALSSLSDSCPT